MFATTLAARNIGVHATRRLLARAPHELALHTAAHPNRTNCAHTLSLLAQAPFRASNQLPCSDRLFVSSCTHRSTPQRIASPSTGPHNGPHLPIAISPLSSLARDGLSFILRLLGNGLSPPRGVIRCTTTSLIWSPGFTSIMVHLFLSEIGTLGITKLGECTVSSGGIRGSCFVFLRCAVDIPSLYYSGCP